MGKNLIISDFSPFFRNLATAGSSTAFLCVQAGGQLEAGSPGAIHKVNRYRFYLVKKILIHQIFNIFVGKNFIIVMRLIQSHAQRGSRSATLIHHHPDGKARFLVLQEVLDHLACFFRYFKHHSSFSRLFLRR